MGPGRLRESTKEDAMGEQSQGEGRWSAGAEQREGPVLLEQPQQVTGGPAPL